MKIKRVIEGKLFELSLTNEELGQAHEEFVKIFMATTLQNDFDLEKSDAEEVADMAYEFYCEGDGLTEYECIQKAYDEWSE